MKKAAVEYNLLDPFFLMIRDPKKTRPRLFLILSEVTAEGGNDVVGDNDYVDDNSNSDVDDKNGCHVDGRNDSDFDVINKSFDDNKRFQFISDEILERHFFAKKWLQFFSFFFGWEQKKGAKNVAKNSDSAQRSKK